MKEGRERRMRSKEEKNRSEGREGRQSWGLVKERKAKGNGEQERARKLIRTGEN